MRRRLIAILLMFLPLLGPALVVAPPAEAALTGDSGIWQPVAAPPAPHGGAFRRSVVTMRNGVALFVARTENQFAAWRFAPQIASWLPTAAPPRDALPTDHPLAEHQLVALTGGTALLLASVDWAAESPRALLYDPVDDRWRSVAAPARPQTSSFGGSDLTLIALPDGRALTTGLFVRGTPFDQVTPWAEVYDPARDTWTAVAPPGQARHHYPAAVLADRRVLVAGGAVGFPPYAKPSETAEIFDPATGSWTPAAPLSAPRAGTTVRLTDGSVLLLSAEGNERYHPAADAWRPAAPAPAPVPRGRYNLTTATVLPGGAVLVAGGRIDLSFPGCIGKCTRVGGLAQTAFYDPAADRWAPGPPMSAPRLDALVASFGNGRVLVVGRDEGGADTAELYAPDVPARCFAETGYCVRGPFLAAWDARGGLAILGYPLSDERREMLEDGQEYTVQYYERARLEYHPEYAGTDYLILLGQFGRRVLTSLPGVSTAPSDRRESATYFDITGHNVGPRFYDYWQTRGALGQFGYPLTEEFTQVLEDGKSYTVQYFERARFEYHPEQSDPQYQVLLGQFGRRILAENDQLAAYPGFLRAYVTDPIRTARLGAPLGPAREMPGAAQQFQRGWMLWLPRDAGIPAQGSGTSAWVYAICGTGSTGRWIAVPDTWAEGQDPGGGDGPETGLYLPRRGFGNVWREREEVRACLGYATMPEERGETIIVQPFQSGYLAFNPREAILALTYAWLGNGGPDATSGRYERIAGHPLLPR